MTITSLGYERGYLEWGIAYLFPWKQRSKLRFNLNSSSFASERQHWQHYVGNISHEEIDIQIYKIGGREAWDGWHNIISECLQHTPKRIKNPFDKNGFLTAKTLDSWGLRHLYKQVRAPKR